MGTPSFHLGRHDWNKIFTGAFMAGTGAVLAYLLDYFGALDLVNPENWWAPIGIAVLGALANAFRKFVTNTEKSDQ